jgi:hypothetical protein
MRDWRSWPKLTAWLVLSCAVAYLAPESELAAQNIVVNGFITAQPISVCATDGSGCAPVNNIGQTGPTALIGFKEPVTGDDVTDFMAAKLFGLRVAWQPLVTFNSPVIAATGTTLQTIHFASQSNPTDCNNLVSPDFQLLVQNFNLVPGSNPPAYTVPSPTNPPGVPICAYATCANVFFVSNLQITTPGCSGVLSGQGRIGGNGSVINKKIFSLPYLPDVIFHELVGHGPGLPHYTTPGLLSGQLDPNAMATGNKRVEPVLSSLNANVGKTVDELTTTQVNQVVDPTGFSNPILEVTTTITGPTTPGSNTFSVTVAIPKNATNTAPTSVLNYFLIPPIPLQPNTFTLTNNPFNLKMTAKNFQGNLGNTEGALNCGPGGFKCFEIDIDPTTPFVVGETFTFSIQISSSHKKTQLTDLAGTHITTLTSEQFATTSDAEFPPNNTTTLTADSIVNPNLAIHAFIANIGLFQPSTNTPCNPQLLIDPSAGCPFEEVSDF